MKNHLKPQPYYYLCQCIGLFIFFSLIVFFKAIDGQPMSTPQLIESLISFSLISLVSHFVIRKIIKKRSNHHLFSFKMYATVILYDA